MYRDGRWLIIQRGLQEKHAPGALALVGGKADYHGSEPDILEKTVRREVGEEVGLEAGQVHYVHSSSFQTDYGVHVMNIVFLCENPRGEAYAKSPEEVGQLLWMTYEETMEHPDMPPRTKESLRRAEQVRSSL
nr:NUDIX domain-containing protein [Ectobacillus ponti]